MNILVACIGNIFQGDDGFGCEVAKALANRPAVPDVRVVDFGIRGLDFAYALADDPDLTILVDSVSRGGVPGTLYTIEPDLTNLDNSLKVPVDAHGMEPLSALNAARAMGAKLARVLLVGCEPADLGDDEGRLGLTPSVADAVARAATIVQNLIERENVGGSR
jgi:hydrogenase maturation protease